MSATSADAIVLRPLRQDDEPELCRIHETPEVAKWWGGPEPGFPWSDEPDATRLAIELDGALVGLIQFYEEPTPRYRHAAIDLFLDPAVHGRGIGTEAVRRLAQTLFEQRGHHRVTIDPSVANAAAIRAYEKAGFQRVGVMRRYEREPDRDAWRDGLLMEMLADPDTPALADSLAPPVAGRWRPAPPCEQPRPLDSA